MLSRFMVLIMKGFGRKIIALKKIYIMNENVLCAHDGPKQKVLHFKVQGLKYETTEQFITGAQIKKMANISQDVDIYLKIDGPYDDELIANDKQVDLALPGIEEFITKDSLKFYVNQVMYNSPSQYIIGAMIRQIAKVPIDDELYLDVPKGWEDEKISDEQKIDLARPGYEKFFTVSKKVTIYINGTSFEYMEKTITYEQVVTMAKVPALSNPGYIVKYNHGPKENPKGLMDAGTVVYVKDKMDFNVRSTHQS